MTVKRGARIVYRITADQAGVLNKRDTDWRGPPRYFFAGDHLRGAVEALSADGAWLRLDGITSGILAVGPVAVSDPGEFQLSEGSL